MPERAAAPPRSLVARLARISYMFLVMNCSAVAGMVSALTGRKVWR
jgi:hypothetical protein